MNLSRSARALLTLGSGMALALAFPNFHFPILAWIAPALLILAVVNERPGFALLLGWTQGCVFYAMSVPWIYTVMRQYGPLSVFEAGGVFILVVIVSASFHAAFALGVAWLSRFGISRACMVAPFLWVSLEFAFTHVPNIGFPWNLLGYAAAGNIALVQLAAVTGIFGLSFVVAAYSSFMVWTILQRNAKRTRAQRNRSLGALAGVTLSLLAIALAGPSLVPQAQADHMAHLVQVNFPQAMSYPNDWMQVNAAQLDELEAISLNASKNKPGIVIWPEVPAPFTLQDGRFQDRAVRLARRLPNGFLLGVVDWKPLAHGGIGATNSAALLGSDGALTFIYDKIHLAPFGEYVPWRNWLAFAGKLTADIGDFQRGSQYKVGRLSGGPFGVFICYEAVFPDEVRRFAASGAQLLVNISNDGWFGDSAAPAQHLAMARVRAVENRRWLLRDTNNGITASVDPYGRIVASMPASIRGELDAPYAFRSDITLYTRWGDWLPWMCVLATLVLLFLGAQEALAHIKR